MLKKLIKDINKHYNCDIRKKNRQRKVNYAKKIYCKLAYDHCNNLYKVAESINITHASVINNNNKIDVLFDDDKIFFNALIKKHNLTSKMLDTNIEHIKDNKNEMDSIYQSSVMKEVFIKLNSLNENQIINFIDTRLDPFLKLNKN